MFRSLVICSIVLASFQTVAATDCTSDQLAVNNFPQTCRDEANITSNITQITDLITNVDKMCKSNTCMTFIQTYNTSLGDCMLGEKKASETLNVVHQVCDVMKNMSSCGLDQLGAIITAFSKPPPPECIKELGGKNASSFSEAMGGNSPNAKDQMTLFCKAKDCMNWVTSMATSVPAVCADAPGLKDSLTSFNESVAKLQQQCKTISHGSVITPSLYALTFMLGSMIFYFL